MPKATLPQHLITYVQCQNGHKLSGLFVLYRPAADITLKDLHGHFEHRFSLGLVGLAGHLDVAYAGVDPWGSFYTNPNPHAAKLLPGHAYECYFVRHPSIQYVSKALEELNAKVDEVNSRAAKEQEAERGDGQSTVDRDGPGSNDSEDLSGSDSDDLSGRDDSCDFGDGEGSGESEDLSGSDSDSGNLSAVESEERRDWDDDEPSAGDDGEFSGGDGRITEGWKLQTVAPAIQTRPLEGGGETQEAILTLEENPDWYYPKGSDLCRQWTLYRDMPHGDCPPVSQAVQVLQTVLGCLRYVIGADPPYEPEQEEIKGSRVLNPNTANVGVFDARTLNAVYVFQKDAAAGNAFRLADRDATQTCIDDCDSSLAFLKGSKEKVAAAKVRADGVVDAATGDAIREWWRGGLRNPRNILVCLPAREGGTDWNVWCRPEAAERLYAWRELTKALGFAKGIAANHAYRGALVDVGGAGFGRSKVSIHKTGLAVDLGLARNYAEPVPDWPIFYSQDVTPPTKNGYRVRWRLFAISDLPLGADDDSGLRTCRGKLKELTSDKHPFAALAAWRGSDFPDILKSAAQKLMDEIDLELARREEKRREEDRHSNPSWADQSPGGKKEEPAGFVDKYFRYYIEPWKYDPWDPYGGRSVGALSPPGAKQWKIAELDEQIKDLKAKQAELTRRIAELDAMPADQHTKEWHKERNGKVAENNDLPREIRAREAGKEWLRGITPSRFLDLTALGREVGLERIGSFTNQDEPKGADWGLAGKAIATKFFKTLADAIAALKPDHGQLSFDLQGKPVRISAVDTDFMAGWAAALAKLKLCRGGTPQVSCALSRLPAGEKAVKELCSAVGQFPDKTFNRVQTGETKTGTQWSAEIQAKLAEVRSGAPPNLNDSSKSSKRKQKSEWTYTLLPTFGAAEGGERIEFLPHTTVYLPAEGAPIGMEWWHFQVQQCLVDRNSKRKPSRNVSFGSLLGALGWSRKTAGPDRLPQLYYRRGAGYPDDDLKREAG